MPYQVYYQRFVATPSPGWLADSGGADLTLSIQRVSPTPYTLLTAADAAAQAAKPAARPADSRPEWNGRALIANNFSAYNGGLGIHVFRAQYVDIVNNTTYWNGQIVNYEELFSNNSRDIVILHNIISPLPAAA